jgi:hypothetical protein
MPFLPSPIRPSKAFDENIIVSKKDLLISVFGTQILNGKSAEYPCL